MREPLQIVENLERSCADLGQRVRGLCQVLSEPDSLSVYCRQKEAEGKENNTLIRNSCGIRAEFCSYISGKRGSEVKKSL
jgi:hypothetical protein